MLLLLKELLDSLVFFQLIFLLYFFHESGVLLLLFLIQRATWRLAVDLTVIFSLLVLLSGLRLLIFGSTGFEVNSSHHQAVKDLGEGLRVVAKSPDGIIEATETTDHDRFLIGVQWHPERLIETDKSQSKLFNAFIQAAKEHASKK